MAYRLTDTNKWDDKWFLDLRPIEKLLFNYLCDNCDCAGFIEINTRKWSTEIGSNSKDLQGALKGLARGLIYSQDNETIYVRTFLKHQKHYPLNPKDNIYKGIISRFENYSYKFNIEDVNTFIEGACKGLIRGNGNDNDNDKDDFNEEESYTTKTWREDFEIYQKELRIAFDLLLTDDYIKERENFHPNLDIKKTIQKACKDFWVKEAGWKNKKKSKTINIDWESTFNSALTQKVNQVWKPRSYEHQNEAPQMKHKKLE